MYKNQVCYQPFLYLIAKLHSATAMHKAVHHSRVGKAASACISLIAELKNLLAFLGCLCNNLGLYSENTVNLPN